MLYVYQAKTVNCNGDLDLPVASFSWFSTIYFHLLREGSPASMSLTSQVTVF